MKRILIWGASGHSKILLSIINKIPLMVDSFIDIDINKEPLIDTVPIYHSLSQFLSNNNVADTNSMFYFAVGIGGHNGIVRLQIHDLLKKNKLQPINLIHDTAYLPSSAQLGEGVQILPMACISEDTYIGSQSIINTNCTVEHETILGKGVHIMPAATIAGCCRIGDFSSIGTNATVLPRIVIGKNVRIGAGAVVTKNIPDNSVAIGVPAKIIRQEISGTSDSTNSL